MATNEDINTVLENGNNKETNTGNIAQIRNPHKRSNTMETNNSNGALNNNGLLNIKLIPPVELGLQKRCMTAAFDRVQRLSDKRIELSEQIKEKGEYKDPEEKGGNRQFVAYNQAEMIGLRASFTKVSSDLQDAKIEYSLKKREYTDSVTGNKKIRKQNTQTSKTEAQIILMQPRLIQEVNAALSKALKNGSAAAVEELILFTSLNKLKDFRFSFDKHMPKIDENLFNQISTVGKVKTVVISAAYNFLKQVGLESETGGSTNKASKSEDKNVSSPEVVKEEVK